MGSATTVVESGEALVGGAVQTEFVERRLGPRYQFTATIELVDLKSRTRVQARTSDLSRGGCYVDTTNPLPVESAVKMRLTQENRSFEAEARVAYSLPGMGMGLAFTSATAAQMEVLTRWLGELSGELTVELSDSEPRQQAAGSKGPNHDPSYVLSTLLIELMRGGLLSNEKGKAMLDQLLQTRS
jgi:hypothetical protein